jgi:hypothetical protein
MALIVPLTAFLLKMFAKLSLLLATTDIGFHVVLGPETSLSNMARNQRKVVFVPKPYPQILAPNRHAINYL